MNQQLYLFQAQENVRAPKEDSVLLSVLKSIYLVVIMMFLLIWTIVKRNYSGITPWIVYIPLIVTSIVVLLLVGKEQISLPFEIRIHENYIVIYRAKHFYGIKSARMEYVKLLYEDIEEFVYDPSTYSISISGIAEVTWYKYLKDCSVSVKPSKKRFAEGVFAYKLFDLPVEELIEIIETYSPIKVIVKEKSQ